MTTLKKSIFYLFLLVPTLVFLIILEITYRAYLYYEDTQIDKQLGLIGTINKKNSSTPLGLKNIIRWNTNPKIIYDLKPSISGIFIDKQLSVNNFGFRGAPIMLAKNSNSLRIIGIGDSVMFGWGVSDSEPYLSRLGEDLKNNGCHRVVDVINSAVPGYNTVMAVATLEAKMLIWNPDIVIYNFVLNDLDLPSFISMKNPVFTIEYSFLLRAIKQMMDKQLIKDYRLGHPPENLKNRSYLGKEEQIPIEYRNLMGLPAFNVAIEKLADLAKKHNFLAIIINHFKVPKQISNVFAKHNILVLSSYPEAMSYLKSHNQKKYLGSDLTVSDTDRHPSATYHRIISNYLARELTKTQWCLEPRKTNTM